ncbi:hypothetical protein JYG23_09115 [Sedimentibacter sp. zth1]|nr:hypothetical protein [Sedimentibacter sp. zth1]QSX04862.1 hypothetical protein JYG23_09115 [Sedimentibacter sp. zth1]
MIIKLNSIYVYTIISFITVIINAFSRIYDWFIAQCTNYDDVEKNLVYNK